MLTLTLGPALSASAHAAVSSTQPVDGAVLDAAPEAVTITFTEPVEAGLGGLRVFGAGGVRVDDGGIDQSEGVEQLTATLREDLAEGTYVATWQVVSQDGHPVQGAIVFQVGEGTPDPDVAAGLVSQRSSGWWSGVGAFIRWLAYLGGLAAVGAAVLGGVLGAPPDITRRVVRRAAAVGLIGSVLQPLAFAAEASGLGLAALRNGGVLSEAVTSPTGVTAAVRIVGLVILLGAGGRSAPAWAAGLVVIAAELVSGHTRTVEPAAVMWTAAAIHLAGSAFWVGGLAVVAAVLAGGIRRHDRARGRTDAGARSAGEVIARFSRLAAWAVAVLAAAGAALGWATVRGPAAVTTTTYGTALLVKLVMVAAALGLALRNRRRLLPNLLADGETAALRRGLAWEVVALAAVVGATAVLVNLPPAAEANAGPISQTVAFGDDLQLNVVVDPGRPGTNEVHLYVLTPGGLPALVEGEAALELRLPAEDLGPIERTPLVAGPGHFLHAGPELALGGEWVLRVRLRESEFEERTGEVTVRIP